MSLPLVLSEPLFLGRSASKHALQDLSLFHCGYRDTVSLLEFLRTVRDAEEQFVNQGGERVLSDNPSMRLCDVEVADNVVSLSRARQLDGIAADFRLLRAAERRALWESWAPPRLSEEGARLCADFLAVLRALPRLGLQRVLQSALTRCDHLGSMMITRSFADAATLSGPLCQPALFFAGDAECVDLLIARGADAKVRAEGGFSPLHRARSASAAARLLSYGVEASVANNARSQPLHYAACPLLCALLVSAGAAPNLANSYGHLPLHLKASRGQWEAAFVLLASGSRLDARGQDGNTPLDLARTVRDKVFGGDGEVVFKRENRRLLRTIFILEEWERAKRLEPKAPPRRIARRVGRCVVDAYLRGVCRDPGAALAEALRPLPLSVVTFILEDFLGFAISKRRNAISAEEERPPSYQPVPDARRRSRFERGALFGGMMFSSIFMAILTVRRGRAAR